MQSAEDKQIIWLGVVTRDKQNVYFYFSCPVNFHIVKLVTDPKTNITQQGITRSGGTSYENISDKSYLPGDYSIGIVLDSDVIIHGINLEVKTGPINPLCLYQSLVGIYRSLGREPSHVLHQPAGSLISATSLSRRLARIEETLKNSDKGTVDSGQIEELKKKTTALYQQLQAAEDYIEMYINNR